MDHGKPLLCSGVSEEKVTLVEHPVSFRNGLVQEQFIQQYIYGSKHFKHLHLLTTVTRTGAPLHATFGIHITLTVRVYEKLWRL